MMYEQEALSFPFHERRARDVLSRGLREMYKKYVISPFARYVQEILYLSSTTDVQEVRYLTVYEMSTRNTLGRCRQNDKKCNISPSRRDTQEITYLAVCDRRTTRNSTHRGRRNSWRSKQKIRFHSKNKRKRSQSFWQALKILMNNRENRTLWETIEKRIEKG